MMNSFVHNRYSIEYSEEWYNCQYKVQITQFELLDSPIEIPCLERIMSK